MISESIQCDICKGEFKMKTVKSNELYDRAHYFAVDMHHEDEPGLMEIHSIAGCKIAEIRKYKAHLCGYKCLGDYFSRNIKEELEKEIEKEKISKGSE